MTTVAVPGPAAAARPLPYQLAIQALDGCRGAMVLCDTRQPGHPIVYANPAFLELTGYTIDQVLGRNCAFLHGPETDPTVCADMRRVLAQGEKFSPVQEVEP